MDNKIYDALGHLASSLQQIADSLKNKTKKNVFQNIDFTKQAESIKTGLKNIKKDTEKILKNQETLLSLSKEKKTNLFASAGENAGKIKQGVNTILLIAGGILAIGVAFKLIGQVDFLSVIALSIALPLVAIAFEKISTMKGITPDETKNLMLAIVTMSAALLISSFLLSAMHPISVNQGMSAILIAATFVGVSYSISKIAEGVKNVNIGDLLLMPLVLITMSFAITESSKIMKSLHVIGLAQGITAILIAGTFAIMSYSIEKLAKGIKDIKASDLVELPLILLTFSIAITLSSQIMRGIHPITLEQGLSAIAIAGTLAVMSLSLPALALAVNLTSIKDAYLMTGILPILALAIVISSHILNKVQYVDYALLLNISLQAVSLGIIALAMGGSAYILAKFGLNSIIEGGLAIVAIAGVMWISSHIISKGDYTNFPSLNWALGTGLSLLAFGIATLAFGTAILLTGGVGTLALLAGAAMMPILAATIIATAAILGQGNYTNFPSLDWSLSTGLSLLAFGTATMALGSIILGTLGLGYLGLKAGAMGIDLISSAIVSASAILGQGNYSGGPTKEWAEGVGQAILAFSPVFSVLANQGIIKSIISSGVVDMSNAILSISSAIVTAGIYFSGITGVWSGGPTKEWAEGVGGAIAAFTPVFDALSKSSGLFGSGPTPDDMSKALLSISSSIVEVGKFFMSVPNIWSGGPTAEWSSNISSALSAFSPIFDYLSKNDSLLGSDVLRLNFAIVTIAGSMVAMSSILHSGKFENSIPEGYMKSMSDNIRIYIDLIDYLQGKEIGPLSFLSTSSVTYGLSKISDGYDKLSKSIKLLGNSINSLDIDKLNSLKTLSGTMVMMSLIDPEQFEKVLAAMDEKSGVISKILNDAGNTNSNGNGFGAIKNASVKEQDSSNADIVRELQILNAIQKQALNEYRSVTSYINEIRSSNNKLKDRKHI